MDDFTRREALAAMGVSTLASSTVNAENSSTSTPPTFAMEYHQEKQPNKPLPEPTPDQKFVMEAGMTRKEAECWKLIAQAAGAFFALPELHPMDKQEVSNAIHVIQNKLLSRPTYRKYLQLAKAAYEKKKNEEK